MLFDRIGIRSQKRKQETPSSPYQQWDGYPDSPFLTETYPYQVITTVPSYSNATFLIGAKNNLCKRKDGSYYYIDQYPSGGVSALYAYTGGNWVSYLNATTNTTTLTGWQYGATAPIEINTPIYTDTTLTTIAYAKTTP